MLKFFSDNDACMQLQLHRFSNEDVGSGSDDDLPPELFMVDPEPVAVSPAARDEGERLERVADERCALLQTCHAFRTSTQLLVARVVVAAADDDDVIVVVVGGGGGGGLLSLVTLPFPLAL